VRPSIPRRLVRGVVRSRHWLREHLRTLLPIVLGAAALVALVLGLDPATFASAIDHFDPWLLLPILGAAVAILVLQGMRWHFLLRELGIELRMGDTVLLSVAGQAITAILPLGDLTRAIFASEVTDAEFGDTAATVTVQELSFTLLLVLAALPALLQLHASPLVIAVTVLGIAFILAILTVPPLFRAVHALVARTPFLRRFLSQIDELQHETVRLLHRADTVGWSSLDLARVVVAATLFWLVVKGLSPHAITWWEAAFVLAIAYVGGAVSLIPGGEGANEATTVGALILLGMPPGQATAAALLQRAFTTGVASILGIAAYLLARRRFQLSGLGALQARAASRR